MKITGLDPHIMNQVFDQTKEDEVNSKEDVFADTQQKNRKEALQGKAAPRHEEQRYTEELEEAVKQANQATEAVEVKLRFQVHEASDRVMVEVVDVKEDEVIREIPPEKILNLVGQIQEMIGFILDEKR